jgi:predicted enzyme related to lactoylglutathione lyase
MHRSRLGTIVIDCQTQDVDAAAAFWSQALGWDARALADPADASYRVFAAPPDQPTVLVQAVAHPSPWKSWARAASSSSSAGG